MEFIYLITKDVPETLERKFGYNVSETGWETLRQLQEKFLSSFWDFVPCEERVALDAGNIAEKLQEKTARSTPLVSLDRIYAPSADAYLEVTRTTDPRSGGVTITERPYTAPLEEQFSSLRKYKEIDIVDVGCFEGQTTTYVVNRLRENGVVVRKAFFGIKNAQANLLQLPAEAVYTLPLFEWVELRDLFGIDGRAAGTANGEREYIPYWENLEKWASISQQYVAAAKKLCQGAYKRTLEILENDGLPVSRLGKIVPYRGK